jgi:PAS domain S-box-containing protein
MIDAMPYPVFYKNRQGRYLGCNGAFERFYGMAREAITGRTVYEIAPKPLADVYFEADEELFTHPGLQTYEGSIQSADGAHHEVSFHKATFEGSDGAVAGLIGVVGPVSSCTKPPNWKLPSPFLVRKRRTGEAVCTEPADGLHDLSGAL